MYPGILSEIDPKSALSKRGKEGWGAGQDAVKAYNSNNHLKNFMRDCQEGLLKVVGDMTGLRG